MSLSLYIRSRPRELAFLARPGDLLVHWLLGSTWLGGLVRLCLLKRYAAEMEQLNPDFDAGFYLSQIVDARFRLSASREPVLHYLLIGQFFNYSPAPAFDAYYYRRHNPDIPAGCSAFLHYLKFGRVQGRPPHPEMRPALRREGRSAALLFDHGRGGGSTRYLDFYERDLQLQGYETLRAIRAGGQRPQFVVDRSVGSRPAGVFDPFEGGAALEQFCRSRGVRKIVANHLIDLPAAAFEWLPALAARIGACYEILLHDYFYVCPRINLVDHGGRYCGIRDAAGCRSCLARSEASLRSIDPMLWRSRSQRLFAGAARIVAPSQDLAGRMAAHFPESAIQVLEPEIDQGWPAIRKPQLVVGQPLHLVLIGGLNVAKGYEVVVQLAQHVRRLRAPLRLTVLGSSQADARLRRLDVSVNGSYREAEIDGLLNSCEAHAAFLPAIWPESWSFVLSLALRHGLPVIAFDHGSIAARLQRLQRGTVLPPQLAYDPQGLLQALLGWRDRHLACAA